MTVERGVAAFYVTLALVLGFLFSWAWVLVVVLVGALPAFLIWRAAGHVEDVPHYYERRDRL